MHGKGFACLLQVTTSSVYLENLTRKVQRHPREYCIITDKLNYIIH